MDFKDTVKNDFLYYTASNFIKTLVESNISAFIPPMSLININVPWIDEVSVKGVRVTKLGFRNYSEDISERIDFRGRNYYWMGGVYEGFRNILDSDCQAIEENLISLSPIKLIDDEMTQVELIKQTRIFLEKAGIATK
jgi:5'-nucleotidase